MTTDRRSSMVGAPVTSHESQVIDSEVRTPTPQPRTPSLAVEITGIKFAHPVLAAPGPLGFGREVQSVVDLRTFAGFITKSVTLETRPGNPHPHLVKTDAGWLNSLGLPNHGLAAFLTKTLPYLRTLGIPIIVSIAGEAVEEFVAMIEWLSQEEGVAAVELNVSCPNVHEGCVFGSDARLTHELVAALRPRTALPLWVKLTPNVGDIVPIARAAEDAGADALDCINAITGLAIDIHTRRPKLGAITGGLSGPALRPIAVHMVWQVARACSIPIIGTGGAGSAEDVLEFLIAGARAVAVGSAAIEKPTVAQEIREGLEQYLSTHGIPDITQMVGTLQT